MAQSDSVIAGLKDENQKLKNELIVAQKKVNAANHSRFLFSQDDT